jgi:ABC-type transport system substrate-binding protein
MAIALETGSIDLGLGMSWTEAQRFMPGKDAAAGKTVFQHPGLYSYLFMFSGDKSSPVADDLYLRQAILYSLDKQGIIDAALGGAGEPEYTLGPDKYTDFDPAWKTQDYYNFNLDKAKEALAKSNYKGQTLRYLVSNAEIYSKTALVIQACCSQIGVKVDLVPVDQALYNVNKTKPATFDMLVSEHVSVDYLASIWLNELDARVWNGTTEYGVKDDELQQALAFALTVEGHTLPNMDKVHRIYRDKAYGIGLFNPTNFAVGVSNIKDFLYDAKDWAYIPSMTFTD